MGTERNIRSPQATNWSEGEGSSDRSLALNMEREETKRELDESRLVEGGTLADDGEGNARTDIARAMTTRGKLKWTRIGNLIR